MKKLSIQKATASLAEYVRTIDGEPLVVTVAGKPVAALVPVEGLDLEGLAVGTNPDFLDLIEHSQRRMKKEGGIPAEEMRRRLSIPMPTEFKMPAKNRESKASHVKTRGARNGGKV
jgi:prevent-host-death family protein